MNREQIQNPHNNQLVLLQLTERNTGHRTYGGEILNITPKYIEVQTYHNLEGRHKYKIRRQDDGTFFINDMKAYFFEPNDKETQTILNRRQTIGQKTEAPAATLVFEKATVTTAKNASGGCLCGCGGTTKGGFFIPGHDMRLKGLLKRITKGEAQKTDIPVGVAAVHNEINFIRTNAEYAAIFG